MIARSVQHLSGPVRVEGSVDGEHGVRSRPPLAVVASYPIAVVSLLVVTGVIPQQAGILALGQIFLPHLVVAAIILIPVAVFTRHRPLLVGLVVLGIVGSVRFGPEWVSITPMAGGGAALQLASWNLEAGGIPAGEVVAALLEGDADVVALQELTPAVAEAVSADPLLVARFPHQVLMADPGKLGMGLLSRHPVGRPDVIVGVQGFVVEVQPDGPRPIMVVNAHPFPGEIRLIGGLLPVSFDGSRRDAQIALVRDRIDAMIVSGEPFVVLGDYNVVSTEPGFARLAAGLLDSHAEVGNGTGWTWRPSRFDVVGLGLLRLDYAFASPGLGVVASDVECFRSEDHCLLSAVVTLP